MVAAALAIAGCGPAGTPLSSADALTYRQRGFECVKRGIQYPYLPSVRAQAVEAMQRAAPADGMPWIRTALADEHPAVRFAACVAAGTLKDTLAREGVTRCLGDDNRSVRVGALYALHRLGDTRRSGELPDYLLNHSDAAVRRNAALVLGRMGETGAIALLARAMRDADEGVQLQALESMALLGGREARQQLALYASSSAGDKEVFALRALAETRDERFKDTYRYKLSQAAFLETKLAAAIGLGLLGQRDGYNLAMSALEFNSPKTDASDDPPENQVRRVRQLATFALGAIGDAGALPALDRLIQTYDDPSVQLAAGKAMLEIVVKRTGGWRAVATSDAPRR